jgi:pimeloyl-ACP methyl ester carboxylesterase
MSTYIFVHGAWHGGWCWYKVVPLLERAGYTVLAPDLPSLGKDKTPVSEVSLTLWAEHVCHLLDAQPEPAVLVGHSRGGIVISEAAERRPDKVKTLVYLSAFLLRNGESLLQLAGQDTSSLVVQNLVVADDQRSCIVREEALRDAFYGDCSDEDVALAKLCLAPEPMAPMATPVSITEANFGRVPRVYIECLHDRAIPPALQKQMYTATPCQKVISMDTSHSPFFSAPQALADHLLAL